MEAGRAGGAGTGEGRGGRGSRRSSYEEGDGRDAAEIGAGGAVVETETTAETGGEGLAGAGRSRLRAAAKEWVPKADGAGGSAKDNSGTAEKQEAWKENGTCQKANPRELREREEGV